MPGQRRRRRRRRCRGRGVCVRRRVRTARALDSRRRRANGRWHLAPCSPQSTSSRGARPRTSSQRSRPLLRGCGTACRLDVARAALRVRRQGLDERRCVARALPTRRRVPRIRRLVDAPASAASPASLVRLASAMSEGGRSSSGSVSPARRPADDGRRPRGEHPMASDRQALTDRVVQGAGFARVATRARGAGGRCSRPPHQWRAWPALWPLAAGRSCRRRRATDAPSTTARGRPRPSPARRAALGDRARGRCASSRARRRQTPCREGAGRRLVGGSEAAEKGTPPPVADHLRQLRAAAAYQPPPPPPPPGPCHRPPRRRGERPSSPWPLTALPPRSRRGQPPPPATSRRSATTTRRARVRVSTSSVPEDDRSPAVGAAPRGLPVRGACASTLSRGKTETRTASRARRFGDAGGGGRSVARDG